MPDHVDVKGNERADTLANRAAVIDGSQWITLIPRILLGVLARRSFWAVG